MHPTGVPTFKKKKKKKIIITTQLWWVGGLMCQSNINPMLKVEGSNPGASILKWLHLD